MDDSQTPGGVGGAMGRSSTNDTVDGSQFTYVSGMYPGRPGESDCRYFLRTGTCAYGKNCRFNHPSGTVYDHGIAYTLEFPERAGEPDCDYYLKTGTCKYGAGCKFNHPKDKQPGVWMNTLGLPMRQDAKPCPFYMQTGVCRYGYACKFHHPQPLSAPILFPVPLTCTSLHQWHSYPSAFIYPSQEWGLYMGNLWPSPASHIVTAQASDGNISSNDLPQRPDKQECRYFISHGTCKYGSNCRYDHPVGRMRQPSSVPVASPGLSSGPGREPSTTPSSEPPEAADTSDLNKASTGSGDDEPPKGGKSPDRSDSFPDSSAASNQNDSD